MEEEEEGRHRHEDHLGRVRRAGRAFISAPRLGTKTATGGAHAVSTVVSAPARGQFAALRMCWKWDKEKIWRLSHGEVYSDWMDVKSIRPVHPTDAGSGMAHRATTSKGTRELASLLLRIWCNRDQSPYYTPRQPF